MAASVHLHEQQTMGLLNAVLKSATNAVVVYDAEHDALPHQSQGPRTARHAPAGHAVRGMGCLYEARRPGGGPLLADELPLSRACRGERVPEMRLEIPARIWERCGSSTSEPSRSSTRTGS